jgi:iron complex outermembrane receptor protein
VIDNTFNQDHPFTAYNTETTTKGYTLFNAGFGGDVYSNKNKQLLSLYFTASNLTDVTYQNHLSRLKYAAVNNVTNRQGVFNIGRNFGIKINIPIGFNL